MESYDPLSAQAKQDPERYFGPLRDACPVHRFVLPQEAATRISENPLVAQPTSEFWSVLRYADCLTVLQTPSVFSSKEGPGPERMLPLTEDGVLLFADDPAHVRQRRIANKAFTPRAVERLKPRIQQIADELIDGFVDTGTAELMEAFAIPLTIRTIAGIIGVEEERVSDFWRWGNAIVAAFGGDTDAASAGLVALQELFTYVQALIDDLRADRRHDGSADGVLAALIKAEQDGVRLTDEEIRWATMQLITAGFETTSTSTVNGVHLLCTHPEEREKLARAPRLIDSAVEEILRYMSPLEGLFRTTTETVSLGGTTIPAGAKVRIVYASANHDRSRFASPDTFKVDRDAEELRSHLAFGLGTHYCIGAALARAELSCGLGTLFRRLPTLALDPSRGAVRATALVINGFRTLPVTWDATSALPATRRSHPEESSLGSAPPLARW